MCLSARHQPRLLRYREYLNLNRTWLDRWVSGRTGMARCPALHAQSHGEVDGLRLQNKLGATVKIGLRNSQGRFRQMQLSRIQVWHGISAYTFCTGKDHYAGRPALCLTEETERPPQRQITSSTFRTTCSGHHGIESEHTFATPTMYFDTFDS